MSSSTYRFNYSELVTQVEISNEILFASSPFICPWHIKSVLNLRTNILRQAHAVLLSPSAYIACHESFVQFPIDGSLNYNSLWVFGLLLIKLYKLTLMPRRTGWRWVFLHSYNQCVMKAFVIMSNRSTIESANCKQNQRTIYIHEGQLSPNAICSLIHEPFTLEAFFLHARLDFTLCFIRHVRRDLSCW